VLSLPLETVKLTAVRNQLLPSPEAMREITIQAADSSKSGKRIL